MPPSIASRTPLVHNAGLRENRFVNDDRLAAIRTALDAAIASGETVTVVVTMESGATRSVSGVAMNWYNGRDGRQRIGLLIGTQTQQALLLDSITEVIRG